MSRGHHNTDDVGSLLYEAASRPVGAVAEVLGSLQDSDPAGLTDPLGFAHHKRHQRLGDSRSLGHVEDRWLFQDAIPYSRIITALLWNVPQSPSRLQA